MNTWHLGGCLFKVREAERKRCVEKAQVEKMNQLLSELLCSSLEAWLNYCNWAVEGSLTSV